uniref:Metalloendopeptidase n=1 Tax=Acrobeloides nanus TaxID=290746 RepID=A0A914DF99_9BILA
MGLPKGVMFNALPKNSPYRWTRYKDNIGYYLIPYIITGKFDKAEKEIIAGAMVSIERNTCIRFKPRKGEEDFLDLHNKEGEGCYTTVGRMPGQNIVMLESNNLATCIEHDIVIHELMHTIGLWHEHMRYDRDDYIKVHYENIDPTYNNQFDKISHQESTTYGIKYDYKSVMHYARDAFSKKLGLTTMETLDKSFINTIGHVQDASPNDYLKICAIYGCSKCMGNVFDLSMLNNTNNTTSKKSITRATRYPPRKITPYISTTTTAITTAELADLNTTTLSIITYPPGKNERWGLSHSRVRKCDGPGLNGFEILGLICSGPEGEKVVSPTHHTTLPNHPSPKF